MLSVCLYLFVRPDITCHMSVDIWEGIHDVTEEISSTEYHTTRYHYPLNDIRVPQKTAKPNLKMHHYTAVVYPLHKPLTDTVMGLHGNGTTRITILKDFTTVTTRFVSLPRLPCPVITFTQAKRP